jgi:hypothetical protein
MKHLVLMAFLIFVCPITFAQNESKPEAFIICKLRGEVRTIAVNKRGDGTFETVYSKNGAPQTVGSGRSIESNRGFMANVKRNLENSNWECREVGSAVVAETPES